MLNAKLIKKSTRQHLKPRFLVHLSAFFRSDTKASHLRADRGYIIDHERINTIRWCSDYSDGWLFAIVIPSGLLIGYFFGPQCAILTLVLCFMPSIFCKLRYTANHREALCCHYGKLKHPGRKPTQIILC